MSSEQNAVVIRDVSKSYAGGVTALNHVSLSIAQGEFFGLLGPNGAGKSTLINCMAGLVNLTGGSISVMGRDVVKERRAAALNLGVVPQEITCDVFLTVRETLRYQSGYWGLRNNDAWIGTILDALGLADKADKSVRQLSGGMKRRVLVAQALVHHPRVIVLDEPTAGVDVELRESLWQLIGELHRQGTTVLLTTHYLEEAQAMCSRVAIMQKGELVAVDRTDRLLAEMDERRLQCRLEAGAVPEDICALLVSQQGPELTFRCPDSAAAHRILSSFLAHGVQISGLSIREASLEDVFLRLTGGER